MTTPRPTPGEPAEFDALFDLAKRQHRAGRLAEAAAAYRKTLASPRHRRGPLQPGHHPRAAGSARPGRGAVRTGGPAPAQRRRSTQQPRRCAAQPAQARRSGGTFPASGGSPAGLRRSAQQPGQRAAQPRPARRSGGTIRASLGPPAEPCRGAQQSGQRAAQPGPARPGGGTVTSKRWLCGRTTPTPTTTWASPCGTRASSTRPRHVTSQALAFQPDYADAQMGLAVSLSGRRGLRRGWPAYRRATELARASAAAQPAALAGRTLGRTQPVVARRARLGGYAPIRSICPAAERAGRSRRAGSLSGARPVAGDASAIWTSCLSWVRPRSCRAAIFICHC